MCGNLPHDPAKLMDPDPRATDRPIPAPTSRHRVALRGMAIAGQAITLAGAGLALVLACYALVSALGAAANPTGGGAPPGLTTLGAGLAFALASAVTAWFGVRIVAIALNQHRRLRETAHMSAKGAPVSASDEIVARVGALAAGAAHELARPLSTMAVVLADLARHDDAAERQADIAILSAQVDACRATLRHLMAAGGVPPAEGGGRVPVDTLLADVARRCRETRPGVDLAVRLDGLRPAPQILAEQSLCQAILILLNNAADASPDDVAMSATWDAVSLKVAIADRGDGVRPEHRERLGRLPFTTKPAGQGTGLGLVLARNALARLGGVVRWSNRPAGGLCAEIELPLGPLRVG